jgi:hypothetical protein
LQFQRAGGREYGEYVCSLIKIRLAVVTNKIQILAEVFQKAKKVNHEDTKTQRVKLIINIPVFVIRSFQSMSLSQERGWGEAIHMVPIFPPSDGSPAILN